MIEPEELIDEVIVENQGTFWSTSALKTIEACGKQYWFRYIERAKTKPTVYLAFGRTVHKVIELVHTNNDFSDKYWQRQWDEEWSKNSSRVDWTGFKKGTFTNMGIKILGKYVDENQQVKVLHSELKFPPKSEDYMIGEFKVRGVIDQIRLEKGRPMVVDFKTSGKEPDPLIFRADPQWTLYWDYARKFLGEEPLLGLYHLKTGKLIPTERTQADVDLVLESLKDAQKKVDQEMFSRSIGFQCNFCDFKDICLGNIGKV